MKLVLPVTLALGGMSLVLAVLAAFMFYVSWASQPAIQYIEQPQNVVALVNSAQDISRLKQVCNFLAESQDMNINVMRNQATLIKGALVRMGLFTIGWGLISGIAFLYLHFLLRRISHDGKSGFVQGEIN
jgi:hypothetical protein